MKKYIMAAIAAVAIMPLFTSCSEDETVKMSTEDGAPIRFSATTKAAKDSRTSYSTDKNTNGNWDLYWVSGDQVTIFCPEANTQGGNENVATYTVGSTTASPVKTEYALTGEGLHWGAADEHHFYEAYPSKNVSEITETKITATIPSTQKAKLQADGYYADMDAALMVGKIYCNKSTVETEGLKIPFAPIFTAVDISIAPSTNTTFLLKSITLANIESETNPAPLVGDFTCDYDFNYDESETGDKGYNLQIEFPEFESQNGITIKPGDAPIKVTAFLRGDFNKPIKVVLNGESKNPQTGDITIGSFKKQGLASQTLIPGARNHIILGALPTTQFKPMTGEWWVSHMHNDTYVSQMSLPGVYDAANFIDHETGDDRAQTHLYKDKNGNNPCANLGINDPETHFYEQMSAYLNAGNRVFDFKPTYKDEDDEWINERIMNGGYRQRAIDFKKMVKAADDWLKVHTTEFIIFVMSDYDWENTSSGYGAKLSAMLRTVIPASRLLESFNADITVDEARGKILVINASPCINPIGISVTDWELNHVVKQGFLSVTDGRSEYNERLGKFFTMGNGQIWVHDYNNSYTKTFMTFVTNNYDYDNKISLMKQSIDKAAADTVYKNWYYTCATFRRNSITFDLTYGDSSGKLRPEIVNKVKGLTGTGTGAVYKKCGIVMQAYSAGEGNDNQNSFENVIWANNYKANGPKKADKQ